MRNGTRWFYAVALLGTFAGCRTGQVDTRTETQAIEPIGCDEFGCGSNSAWLGEGIVFHELDMAGAFNDVNLKIVAGQSFDGQGWPQSLGNPITLEVVGDQLCERTAGGEIIPIFSPHYDNASMLLQHTVNSVTTYYRLRFAQVNYTNFWDMPAYEPKVPVYDIRFQQVTSPSQIPTKNDQLCSPNVSDEWGSIKGEALLFTGDRYVAARKIVTQPPKDTWFNVACAGSAIAKLHLLHYTLAGGVDHVHPPAVYRRTTVLERQTMLRLITAAYCPDGRSFTTNGVRLMYDWNQPDPSQPDWSSPYPIIPGTGTFEAIWKSDGSGAECLHIPRLLTTPPNNEPTGFAVHEDCQLRACSDWDIANWRSEGYAASAAP